MRYALIFSLLLCTTVSAVEQVADINGYKAGVDSAAPTVPLLELGANQDWGDMLVHNAAITASARAPFVVDTVANLQALAAPYLIDGQTYRTLRYSSSHTVGDGSGNTYRYVDADATSADGGFVISHADGRFHAIDKNVANPLQFGAYAGAAAATNTTAFQAAIDAVGNVGHVKIPAGTFDHNGLTIDYYYFRFEGAGQAQTILEFQGSSGTGIDVSLGTHDFPQANLVIKNMSLTHADTGTGQKIGLSFNDVQHVELENVTIQVEGGNSVGLRTRGREFFRMVGCDLRGPVAWQVGACQYSTPLGSLSADFFTVENCYFGHYNGSTPTNWPDACILVGEYDASTGALDDTQPIQLSNFHVKDSVFLSPIYGFHFVATSIPTSSKSYNIAFTNCRKESTPTTDECCFLIDIDETDGGSRVAGGGGNSLTIKDFYGENSGQGGGLEVRGISVVTLENFVQLGGGRKVVEADFVETLAFNGVHCASTVAATAFPFGSRLKKSWGSQHKNGYPFPTHGLWTWQSSFVNAEKSHFQISDGSVYAKKFDLTSSGGSQIATLPLDANAQNVQLGKVEIIATDNSTVYASGQWLLVPGLGTNGIVLQSGTANCAASDTASSLCFYATGSTGGMSGTTVKNNLGVAVKVLVVAHYYRTALE